MKCYKVQLVGDQLEGKLLIYQEMCYVEENKEFQN